MCQDLTSRVSTLSNHALQHVDQQNTTDGLPLSRPSHMECYKYDNMADLCKFSNTHTLPHCIHCWMHLSTHRESHNSMFCDTQAQACTLINTCTLNMWILCLDKSLPQYKVTRISLEIYVSSFYTWQDNSMNNVCKYVSALVLQPATFISLQHNSGNN